MKIALCFGTRPEVIKLFLLSRVLESEHEVKNIFTGQHSSLYDDVKNLIHRVDYVLPSASDGNMCDLYSRLTKELGNIFVKEKPDLVIVQGDTASSYAASLSAFLLGIKIGHVEAGLRTNNIRSPYPEEFNRQMISKLAYLNWCPSDKAAENLMSEKINGRIIVTGNTIVDTVRYFSYPQNISSNNIVITLHRRENKDKFYDILRQIDAVAKVNPNLKFVFPVHPNPIIRNQIPQFESKNIIIVEPMPYEKFILELNGCVGIISDSGGIQEEAVCLRKKVLVCRENTERSEGIDVGLCKLIGCNIIDNFEWLLTKFEGNFVNPYGDGDACVKIERSLVK